MIPLGYQEYRDASARMLAMVIRAGDHPGQTGVTFHTDKDQPLQIGHLIHPEGRVIAPHVHPKRPRVIEQTTEVLLIRKGAVKVTLYGDGWEFQEVELSAGDLIALFAGGHGLEVSEDCDIIEIKQGPYSGRDRDKEDVDYAST